MLMTAFKTNQKAKAIRKNKKIADDPTSNKD